MVNRPSHKAEFIKRILYEGFEATDFKLEFSEPILDSDLNYCWQIYFQKHRVFYFSFTSKTPNAESFISINYKPSYERVKRNWDNYSWQNLFNFFTDWIKEVINFLSETLNQKITLLISNITIEDSTPFTKHELKDIKNQLIDLKEHISKIVGLQKQELKNISEKLDELIKSSKVNTKINWKEMAVGALMGTIPSIIIDPTTRQTYIDFINNFFSGKLLK
jgi:hypothetical protein